MGLIYCHGLPGALAELEAFASSAALRLCDGLGHYTTLQAALAALL